VLAAAAIVAGADGLLDKRSLGGELCNAFRQLAHGRRVLPAISRSTTQALGSQLRPRDQAAFGMLMHGVSAAEIAERLHIGARGFASSRWRTLLTLAPKLDQPAVQRKRAAPLDYEPTRARLRAQNRT
jgi:hypothetical protein